MKIAIDLDDVLTESLSNFISYYNKKYNKNIKPEDFTAFSFHEINGMPIEEETRLMEEYDNSKFYLKIKPLKGAVEAVKILSKKHELFIITSRPQEKEKETREWIVKFFGEKSFKDILFIRKKYLGKSKSKAEIVKELGAKVLLEDHPKYAKECEEKNIPVILFNYACNINVKFGYLVSRVNGWSEALKIIEETRE